MALFDNFDITSANAEIQFLVEGLIPTFALQMFSVDSAASLDSIDITETRRGVDGKMVAGVIKEIIPITITLEAASPSYTQFQYLWQAMNINNRPYAVSMIIALPSIKGLYTFPKGVLKNGQVMPTLARVLEPTTWQFDFENVIIAQLNV